MVEGAVWRSNELLRLLSGSFSFWVKEVVLGKNASIEMGYSLAASAAVWRLFSVLESMVFTWCMLLMMSLYTLTLRYLLQRIGIGIILSVWYEM